MIEVAPVIVVMPVRADLENSRRAQSRGRALLRNEVADIVPDLEREIVAMPVQAAPELPRDAPVGAPQHQAGRHRRAHAW